MTGMQVNVLPDGRLTAGEAAKYLGFSVGTLAVKRQKGTGPRFVKAGRVFYFKADLDEWVNKSGRLVSTIKCRKLRKKKCH